MTKLTENNIRVIVDKSNGIISTSKTDEGLAGWEFVVNEKEFAALDPGNYIIISSCMTVVLVTETALDLFMELKFFDTTALYAVPQLHQIAARVPNVDAYRSLCEAMDVAVEEDYCAYCEKFNDRETGDIILKVMT